MANEKLGFFNKVKQATESFLDNYIEKAQTNASGEAAWHRKGLLMVDYGQEQQAGWIERRGLVGPGVLRNMARKDSIIMAIIRTRLSQVSAFAQPQKDKYSPGFKIQPKKPADMTREEKLILADPNLTDEEREQKKYEIMQNLAKHQDKIDKDCEKIKTFILHCGMSADEMETDKKRTDFDKFVKLLVMDTLTYNFCAIEKIPQKGHKTKDDWKLHHFYPVSAGDIKHISKRSAQFYKDFMLKKNQSEDNGEFKTPDEEYKYVQVSRGKVEAAWTESEMIFEPRIPTVDPEDMGYAQGELEQLILIVTAHLYAEAHNRNFFTQGLGTKGLLHIKGESISQAQLEGFKRQWFSQVINSRNAFRPPIIGIADEVKWVPLAANNKDMEFDNWMHYLIRIVCAVYQIDPAEINFDISKINTSTLNESSNETRIKSSRDKGLRPLLDYIENILNRHILQAWDSKLADNYEFKFVGLNAETRIQEAERLNKETGVWKTFNEARIEQGKEPLEHGDIIGNAIFAQYLAQVEANVSGEQDMSTPEQPQSDGQEDQFMNDVREKDKKVVENLDKELEAYNPKEKDKEKPEKKAEEKTVSVGPRGGISTRDAKGNKEYKKPTAKLKKAVPVKVEYYEIKEDDEE